MKPTLTVEGEEYPVLALGYDENGITFAHITKGVVNATYYNSNTRTEHYVEEPLKLDFDKVLNLNSDLEDKLIKHLEGVYEKERKTLEDIAYTAAEDSVENIRLFNKVLPEQSCRNAIKYLEQQQKMLGMCDAIEEVKAYFEGYYDKGGEEIER